mgnify:FL=1
MKIAVISGMGAVWGAYDVRCLFEDGKGTVGGGEAAMLHTSFQLAAFEHGVTVFYPGSVDHYRGVSFRPLPEAYPSLLADNYDAVCSWSDFHAIRIGPPHTRRVFVQQLNNMPDPGDVFWRNVDVIVPASATHGRFLAKTQTYGASVAYMPLYGGVTPQLYADARPFWKRKPVVSWWSSPDRGLHHLLMMWPVIRREIPQAELRIAYHTHRFIEDTRSLFKHGEVAWRARELEGALKLAQAAGGVYVLGAIPRKVLAKHQGETKVWAFPFDSICSTEGLCVSASEAIVAGCWPIVRPDDALREVYDGYVQWVPSMVCDDAWRGRFCGAIIAALRATANPYAAKATQFATNFTWPLAAKQLERACQAAITRVDWGDGPWQGM